MSDVIEASLSYIAQGFKAFPERGHKPLLGQLT